MRYLKQFFIILVIAFFAEILHGFLPLPIPASIYGMVTLFILLVTKVIKLEQVKDTGKFLISIMPIMFIVPGVGIISSWDTFKPVVVPVLIIIIACNITVMVASGRVSQTVIRLEKKKRGER